MFDVYEWARRWGVPVPAINEMLAAYGAYDPVPAVTGASGSESRNQSELREAIAHRGGRLWRNNVGALLDSRGVPVRYGLANDSKALNAVIKSGDLIGIQPRLVTADMVGTVIGQFISREVKATGWHYTGTAREQAQLRWAMLVNQLGGDAKFSTETLD